MFILQRFISERPDIIFVSNRPIRILNIQSLHCMLMVRNRSLWMACRAHAQRTLLTEEE